MSKPTPTLPTEAGAKAVHVVHEVEGVDAPDDPHDGERPGQHAEMPGEQVTQQRSEPDADCGTGDDPQAFTAGHRDRGRQQGQQERGGQQKGTFHEGMDFRVDRTK